MKMVAGKWALVILKSPLRRKKKEWQSTLVSSASYSALAPSPLLTLMHCSGNISGMLIP